MNQRLSIFWHRTLRRPYRLKISIDQGQGTSVLLLHGLGSSGSTWHHLATLLEHVPARLIAFDLLGFGASPNPSWSDYSVDDHARAVIASLNKSHIKQPVVLVGHSMGCLVAVHIARLKPKLVKKLILYEMPLYEGLPDTRRYRWQRDLYYKMYARVLRHPNYSTANARVIQKIAAQLAGFAITPETWHPFVRSLENTIMKQTTLVDLKRLNVPTEIIYGSLDVVVIRGKPKQIFGDQTPHIKTHIITDTHGVSPRASKYLAKRIQQGL